MPGAGFISHRGKSILHIDFRGCYGEESLPIMAEARKAIAAQPLGSVLVLTDVTGAHYNERIMKAIRELASANRPFVKASAVVGITGVRRVLFNAVAALSNRQLTLFESEGEAKDWLASRP